VQLQLAHDVGAVCFDRFPAYAKRRRDFFAASTFGEQVAAATPGSQSATDTKKALGSSPSKPMAVEVVPPANTLQSTENLLGPLVTAGVIAIFTIFILIGREDLRNRFIRLAGRGSLNAMT
jgi:hypothetical protein